MDFCRNTASIWVLLGYVVFIFKIVIPLILIILGMVDLGKAVVASKDDAINKAVSALLKRFIAAIIIFFIPTIVSAIFSAISIMTPAEKRDYEVCVQCVTNMNATMKLSNNESKSCKQLAEENDGSPYVLGQ